MCVCVCVMYRYQVAALFLQSWHRRKCDDGSLTTCRIASIRKVLSITKVLSRGRTDHFNTILSYMTLNFDLTLTSTSYSRDRQTHMHLITALFGLRGPRSCGLDSKI